MANYAISRITITHSAKIPVLDIQRKLCQPTGSQREFIRELINELKGFASGARNGSMIVELENATNTTKATGTITCTGVPTANDTVTIGGKVLTWKASAGNENEITIGGSATTSGDALAAAINANSVLAGLVSATAATGVVTITCVVPGRIGNLITTAEAGTNTTVQQTVLSGATATQQAAARTFDFGGVA